MTDGAADPEWSPDGHKLVYTRSEGLFSSNEDGSNVHQITRVAQIDGYSDACPAWSPRGDFIVFLRREEPVADTVLLSLQIVRPDGKGERQIADMGSPNARETPICPAWSPDGRWIAWKACRAPEPPGVCLINIHENQRVVKVARTSVFSTLDPSWSPDGTMIAFTLYDDVDSAGPGRLMLVAATGGLARQLLQKPPPLISQEGDFSSSWSGDGQSIAFVRQRKRLGTNEVFVVRPDGSGLHRLTKAPAEATR